MDLRNLQLLPSDEQLFDHWQRNSLFAERSVMALGLGFLLVSMMQLVMALLMPKVTALLKVLAMLKESKVLKVLDLVMQSELPLRPQECLCPRPASYLI